MASLLQADDLRRVVLESPRIPEGGGDRNGKDTVIIPDGKVISSAGMFHMTPAGAESIISAFKRLNRKLVVDFEHQSLGGKYARADGLAPAAGWIVSLRYTPGVGLQGDIQWNGDALRMIRSGKYKYLSPVVFVAKTDRSAVALESVGLVNSPAIEGFPELRVNKQDVEAIAMADIPSEKVQTTASVESLVAELASALGMEVSDDAAVLQAAIDKIKAVGETPTEAVKNRRIANSVRTFCSLPDDADHGQVETYLHGYSCELGTLNAHKAHAEDRLSIINKDLREAEKRNRELEAIRIVGHTDHHGKLTESARSYELETLVNCQTQSQFDARVKDFQERMARSPVVLKQDRLTPWTGPDPDRHRYSVICDAKREHDDAPSLQRMTSRAAYIDDALREGGLDVLTNVEREKHSQAR